jgi:secretion/DNA translocation related TadE-like protein
VGRAVTRRTGTADRERGAGTVLLLGVVAVVLLCTVGLAALGAAQHARARAQSAADLAALAGAAAHRAGLGACDTASASAGRHDATLVACVPGDDGTVTVTVSVAATGPTSLGDATARARAGPATVAAPTG